MTFIYLITNHINGKYYVGKTRKPVHLRLLEHVKVALGKERNYRSHLQGAMRKHGPDKFAIEVLATAESEKQANALEKLWIIALRATEQSVGYNISGGGDGFSDPTGSIKRKISETLKGRKLSPERCKQISLCVRGRKLGPFSAEHRRNLSLGHHRMHGPELSPELKLRRGRERMSESAKARWAAGNNCEASRACLQLGRSAEKVAHARKFKGAT